MHTHRIGPRIALIALSALFFLAQDVYATAVVRSEFELKLPRGFQQRIIDNLWNSLQRQVFSAELPIPDQTMDAAETKVLLSGIKVDLNTRLQKPAVPAPGPSLTLVSRSANASLKIQSVSVDQYIVREIGGVIGRFHLQAKCENLDLHLKPDQASFKMKLSPVIRGAKVSSRVEDLELAWSKDAWTLEPMTCTGAQGFEDIITEHILEMTKDSTLLTAQKAELMNYVQSYLDKKSVDVSNPRVLSAGRSDIQYAMSLTGLSVNGADLTARGVLSVQFKNVNGSNPIYLALDKAGREFSGTTTQLRLPEKFLEVLAEKAFTPRTWSERLPAAKVPGFSSLMHSHFVKCFVWPELIHFSNDAPFVFDFTTSQPFALSGTNLEYQASTVIDIHMLAPKDSGENLTYTPFVNFQMPLKSHVRLSLEKGVLAAHFTGVQLGLEPRWADSYVMSEHPNQKISVDKITPRILQAAEGTRIAFEMPRFQILGNVSLKLQSVSTSSGNDLVFVLY